MINFLINQKVSYFLKIYCRKWLFTKLSKKNWDNLKSDFDDAPQIIYAKKSVVF